MEKNNMGNYSLQDLALSGVKWELTDAACAYQETKTAAVPNAEKKRNQEKETAGAKPAHPAQSPKTPGFATPAAPVVSISDALESARNAAAAATDFAALCAAVESADHPLKAFAKTIPPHAGAAARIAIVTDAPSGDDDQSGKILSGAAGELLDKMLSAIGLGRDSVAIIPLVFWRPAGGRTPSREELDLARPYVLRALDLARPETVLTLGTLAAVEIADAKLPAQHGEIFRVSDIGPDVPVVPIFHPNYLLLKPDAKKPVWEVLQKILQMPNESLE